MSEEKNKCEHLWSFGKNYTRGSKNYRKLFIHCEECEIMYCIDDLLKPQTQLDDAQKQISDAETLRMWLVDTINSNNVCNKRTLTNFLLRLGEILGGNE